MAFEKLIGTDLCKGLKKQLTNVAASFVFQVQLGKIVDKESWRNGQAVRVSGAYGMCLIAELRIPRTMREPTHREAGKGELRGQ